VIAVSTPGLIVSPRVRLRRARRLPVEGEVLVELGASTDASRVVARAELPGPLHPVSAAAALGVPRAAIVDCVKVRPGDVVGQGSLLASARGLLGLFNREVRSPVGGSVESISADTGQIVLRAGCRPVELAAYLAGEVVEVVPGWSATIEAEATLVQGVFGTGGEAIGELALCGSSDGRVVAADLKDEHCGRILAMAGSPGLDVLRRAREVGVAAVVAAGVRGADLRELAGREINLAATGDEDLGFVLVITEGFGGLKMGRRAWEILSALEGRQVSVSGATQVRAGVIRPELVAGPLDAAPTAAVSVSAGVVGTRVRVVRGRHFGALGVIRAAPAEPGLLATGARAAVFEVELDSGERAVLPRSNVEALAG
jgi:hypothetical protein